MRHRGHSAVSSKILTVALCGVAIAAGCSRNTPSTGGAASDPAPETSGDPPLPMRAVPQSVETFTDPFRAARRHMVDRQIRDRGIVDPRVLAAVTRVPRHEFVPPDQQDRAYEDRPLSIGHGQTISQPYIVAYMTEQLELAGDERVLEVGTGSGYQAAVLAEVAAEVFSIEIIPELAEDARRDLARLSYENVHVRTGDGYRGWPEHAPFDAIILTAAPDHVPEPLVEQLAVGGRMILPIGRGLQELMLIERTASEVRRRRLLGVRFVPMRGQAEEGR